MPQENVINTQCEIKIGGSVLPLEEQNLIVETIVDQHTHLPHMFTIRMYDPGMKLLDSKKFDLTKEVEISGTSETGTKTILLKGEITALEPEFQEGTVFVFVIRGYDKSHRLFRECKSQAFLNIKDSDLANQFAGGAGLSAQVDATSTVYEHLYQDNQSDLAFLMQRAWRIGYECFVDDGKLYFRKPPSSGTTVTLSWGKDLLSFFPSMTLAEQVDSVEVKGWDPKTLKAILGKSQKGTLYPKNGDNKDGAKWASSFGTGKHTLVDIPVVSQAEADKIAEARLNELSGAFVSADGTAIRRPDIKAGQFVKLEDLGTRMSGTYMVTSARHIFTHEGLITKFTVSGTRTGLLAEQMAHQEPVKRWPGVVTAVVTNTDDPDDWGRVKIKYPWMTEDAESFWARLAGPGAGPTAGFIAIPEVGDEVLVAFEYGDINYPVILGGLWNGKHAIPPATAGAATGEKPLIRSWHSINGHTIDMFDNADKKIQAMTIDGHLFVMDDTNKKVEIVTKGGHIVTLDDNGRKIIVESKGDIEITSPTNIKIEAKGNIEMKATADVKIDGLNVGVNANVGATVKGGATAEVSASGSTTIKGAMVQIN
jgi:phage protein D